MDDDQLAELRNSRIGFVFQLHYLLPQFTLIENVLLPVLPTRDKARQSAARERAWNLINKVGLTLQAHQRPAELSVGECQRAAVVRALINQPVLLLADEPTGSLDAENATMLASLLNDLKLETELSMVVVTHSMDLAEKMDTIYRLQSGNLAVFDK
jgi:ABC-type lipoprotein export system ATPase subunit